MIRVHCYLMRAFNFSPRSFSLRRWPMCSEDFLKIQRSLRSSCSSSVYFISVRHFISWSYLGIYIERERLKGGLREWENERGRTRHRKRKRKRERERESKTVSHCLLILRWLKNWLFLFSDCFKFCRITKLSKYHQNILLEGEIQKQLTISILLRRVRTLFYCP